MNAACVRTGVPRTCVLTQRRSLNLFRSAAAQPSCLRSFRNATVGPHSRVECNSNRSVSSPPVSKQRSLADIAATTAALTACLVLGPSGAAHATSATMFGLPIWMELILLGGINIGGLFFVMQMVRQLGDTSEPCTVAKVQIGLLENHPHLQGKLAQLSSMIQVGQVGTWLILEEAILEVLKHQSHIAYADVKFEEVASKKVAYGLFGQLAAEEAQKAEVEERAAQVHNESSMEEDSCSPSGGLWGMLGGQDCGIKGATEATVVTLVVAARGRLDINRNVSSWPELRHTLQQLTGLTSDKVMCLELLWTPTQENEYLSRQQLRSDYPDLMPLQRDAM